MIVVKVIKGYPTILLIYRFRHGFFIEFIHLHQNTHMSCSASTFLYIALKECFLLSVLYSPRVHVVKKGLLVNEADRVHDFCSLLTSGT